MPLPTRLIHFALDQVPSFSAYLPYLAYDPDHQLYLVAKDNDTTKLAWGVIFECLPHPAPGEKQATNLKGIFDLTLPMGSTIQITAAALQTETIPTLLLYRSLRHGLQHTEHANRRIHRLAGLLLSGSQELPTAPLRNTVVLVSLSIPITPHRRTWHARLQTLRRLLAAQTGGLQYETVMAALPQVKRAATDIEQLLIQASLFPQRVPPDRLMTLLHPVLTPSHPYRIATGWEPDRELRRQMIPSDTQIIPTVDGAQIDQYHFRSITPLQFPADFSIDRMEQMVGSLMNSTQQIPANFFLTLNAAAYDRTDASRSLHRKFAITSQQAIGPMARIIPRLGLKSEQYSITMHALENSHIPLAAYLHLMVWAPTATEANQAAAASEALWKAHNFVPQSDGPASLNVIRESLPLALSSHPRYLERDLARARTLLSSNCASLSPIAGDWKGNGSPILLLVSRRGQIAAFDPFANPNAYNFLTAGSSGGGKSVLNNDLVLGLIGTGTSTIIVDKGKSYEKLVTSLKGDYLLFNADTDINLNPFSFVETAADFTEQISGLKALVAQMASPSRPVSDWEDSQIGQSIQKAYGIHGKHTTIGDVATVLSEHGDPRCRDLADCLYPYAQGEYARFFQGPATINVRKSKLLLLELEELSTKPKLQSVVFLAIILAIQSSMEQGDRHQKKCVLIDEAWSLLQSKQAAECIEELFRRGRKYSIAVGVVTQSLHDLIQTTVGKVILDNADSRFLFPHHGESLRDDRLALTPYEVQLIRSLHKAPKKYSEVYVKAPGGAGIYRHIVDPISYQLFTTSAEEVARLQDLMKGGGLSLQEAIKTVLTDDGMEKPIPPPIAQALA